MDVFRFCAGGEVAAMMYTLIASAAGHQLDLWAYVDDALRCLAAGDPNLAEFYPTVGQKRTPSRFGPTEKTSKRHSKPRKEKNRRTQRRKRAVRY